MSVNVGNRPNVGNVYVAEFDVDILRFVIPEWDALPAKAKLAELRALPVHPDGVQVRSNATLSAFHDHLADYINPETTKTASVSALDVGDGTSTPATTNTGLDNRLGEVVLTDAANVDETATFSYLIDSTQFNGKTLAEVSLTATNGENWNRALLSPAVEKTNSKVVVVDVEVTFGDA